MTNVKQEIKFLDGPQSRWKEFTFTLHVLSEFIKGFRHLHFAGPCVTIFGSARFKEEHPYYQQTQKLAAEVAKLGFTVMTGGGPGIMEAANRGAKDVGGKSVGCNILLEHEQQPNKYLDKWVNITEKLPGPKNRFLYLQTLNGTTIMPLKMNFHLL